MIEKDLDVKFVAPLAMREKQIQQNYRPIIGVHKWFARRPGTLFRGLLLAEFAEGPLSDAYYRSHQLGGLTIADPFMGGGTPLIEANRLGCNVIGLDINPMSYWIVKQELEHLDLEAYQTEARRLVLGLEKAIGHLYRTKCECCGNPEAYVKYYLWVKCMTCQSCGQPVDLFSHYLVASRGRHPSYVWICPECGCLSESETRDRPGRCEHCGAVLEAQGPAARGRCQCSHCGASNSYPDASAGPPQHRLVAIEYHCPACRDVHTGRYFKAPDARDLSLLQQAEALGKLAGDRYVPEDLIPSGDETNRLHRWGYKRYRELFNQRQLLGLQLSAEMISAVQDTRVRNALATNLSDLLRYQNMLCRYDTVALKSLDIFSIHGFPVGLVQCESNLLGIQDPARGVPVGSGGWLNVIEKFGRAKAYCESPFEVRHVGAGKTIVHTEGEWIGDRSARRSQSRSVDIRCADAGQSRLNPGTVDAILTDPPYYGNVQYAELMDFCYVWLRLLVGHGDAAFASSTTRDPHELTGNIDMGRGLPHFADGLSRAFQNAAVALKPGAPFCFTYHHNSLEAYFPIVLALLDAHLVCSATLPCPGEMAASIHINGTGSSVIDSVFVCRTTGQVPRRLLADSADALAGLVASDLAQLKEGGVRTTAGDARCIAYGHIARMAVWNLRHGWNTAAPIEEKLSIVRQWVNVYASWPDIQQLLHAGQLEPVPVNLHALVREAPGEYCWDDTVSF